MKKPDLKLPRIDFRGMADDFRHLNPNDVGTWPLLPRATALVALFSLLVAAGWWFLWQDQMTALESSRAEETRLKEEFLGKKRQAVNLELHRAQLKEIDLAFGAQLKQLPNKAEVAALLVEVNQAGLGRGLQFELFKPGTEQVKEFYAELPVSVRLIGSYHDFGAFAGDIGRLSRIVTLNNVSISAGKGGQLTLDAVAKTFRYLDEEEVAARRKAEQAAKKKGRK